MKRIVAGCLLLCAASAQAQNAKGKPYTVAPGFKNVPNFAAVQKKVKLSSTQQAMLQKNLVMARQGNLRQLFHVYENNDYLNLPSFVTTDSVLQLYHIFFSYTLRTAESKSFLPALKKLTAGMLKASVAQWQSADNSKIKEAALKNVAYFAVADRLLGQSNAAPEDALKLARVDLNLATKRQGFGQGAIFPYQFDYSQFAPRGHYTRTQDLRRYFGAMMWFGLVPFAARTADGNLSPDTIRQSLLWTRTLRDANLLREWQAIYEPTAFYVGAADDLTPQEFLKVADEVFGAGAPLSAYANESKYAVFADKLKRLRAGQIQAKFGLYSGVPQGTPGMIEGPQAGGVQVRFMGQRYIPDSEILQRLSVPIQRVFPSGLDVMAVMGNKRAAQILDAYPQIYNAKNWRGYWPERAKLTQKFAAMPRATWQSNLYWGWLDALRVLQEPAPTSFPAFMRGAAWQDKTLNTALASWSQLRHDTILYGKQSVVQCGDGSPEPPFVKGYVEPNVRFYARLLALLKQSRSGLESRKLMPEALVQNFEEFEDLLKFLQRVSEKQLRGEKLTRDEYLEIRYLGGKLEYMTISVIGDPDHRTQWELLSETEKDMAVIADVHTGGGKALQEGVGRALEIYVVVPIEGKLSLTRGAAFSYFEFKHPISDRLTDEKWQAMLKAGKAPAPPIWTKSFLAPGINKTPNSELEAYNSGC
jgi:hypothetical protein